MATSLDAETATVEVTERGDRLTITIRDGADVAIIQGSPGALLGLAQSLRSVVVVAT